MLPQPHDWYAGLRLRLLPLNIAIRWSRPSGIPPHILANVLRGAFNITFRRLVCPPEWMDNACAPCHLYAQCPYGQLFEPAPPPDADRLRLIADLPRPFILKPPLAFTAPAPAAPRPSSPRPQVAGHNNPLADRLRVRNAFAKHGTGTDAPVDDGHQTPAPNPAEPERLRFGLVLVGRAVDQLAHFIVTLAELGRVGMGPHRVPFTIESVTTTAPGTEPESLYNPATHTFTNPQHIQNGGDFLTAPAGGTSPMAPLETQPSDATQSSHGTLAGSQCPPETLPATPPQLTLRFLTPTLIRTGSGVDSSGRRIPAVEVRERPPFGVLIRRLRDRLSALCTFFGEAPWTGPNLTEPDFAAMGRLADEVRLVRSETTWHHRSRYSTRTGDIHEISGLTGTATYAFDTPAHRSLFLPLLKCGELIHIGKHSVWGNGWVEVQP